MLDGTCTKVQPKGAISKVSRSCVREGEGVELVRAFGTAFALGVRLTALIFVVALVGVAILGRIVEGELSGWHAVIVLFFLAGLLFGVVFFWHSPLVFAVFLIAAGLAALWGMLRLAGERQMVRQMLLEEEQRYKATLERDPRNAAAWSALGDLYLDQRRFDEAIACYERAVQLMPTDPTEKRKLQRAQRLKQEAEAKGKFCPQCRFVVPPLTVQCPNCGFDLPVPVWAYFLAAASDRAAMRKVLLTFAIAFPLASLWIGLLALLHPLWRAFLLLATLSAIAIVLWVELRRQT